MKKYNILPVLVTIFLIFGCAAPESPTQPPVESPTAPLPTLTATSTLLPTATERPVTPTLTPEPGLRTDGPYLAYFRQVPDFSACQFVLMDADGGGRKVIDLPA